MKIYVAARFGDSEKVKKIYQTLIKKGHTITTDWTTHIKSTPYTKHPKRSRDYAVDDIEAILKSDIFILLTHEERSTGTSAELGAALASCIINKKPKIYIVGPHVGNNMFYFHLKVNVRKNIQEVYKELT